MNYVGNNGLNCVEFQQAVLKSASKAIYHRRLSRYIYYDCFSGQMGSGYSVPLLLGGT